MIGFIITRLEMNIMSENEMYLVLEVELGNQVKVKV